MKFFHGILLIALFTGTACKETPSPNTVDMGQIQSDGSNNYEYIFKDKIDEEQGQKKVPEF